MEDMNILIIWSIIFDLEKPVLDILNARVF